MLLMIFTIGVCENEAVQRRAAGILLDLCPVAAPQHHSSGHQGLLSRSGGEIFFLSHWIFVNPMNATLNKRLTYKKGIE